MSTRLPYGIGCLRRTGDSLTQSLDHEEHSAHAHAHPSGSGNCEADRNASSQAPAQPPMHIVLENMRVNGRASACDFVVPHVRRSALVNGPIQHLDVVSCWKGVTHSQAWELATWDCFFKECLAMQIKEHLGREFSRSQRHISSPNTLRCMVDRMMYFLTRFQPMWIDVDMLRLVDDMIARMYTAYRSDTAQRRFPWTMSSGDLPSLVYNFAHAQDCLIFSNYGPSVCARFSSRFSQGDMIVYVDLDWSHEKTSFMGLRDRLSCGKSYRITPFTEVVGAGSNDRCKFSRARSDITYSVGKASLPLQWDDEQECFHSLVHRGTQDHNGLIVTEVSAKISTPFHDGVRFERISRYSLKLRVDQESPNVPADPKPCNEAAASTLREFGSPWIPSYTNTPLSKTGFEAPQQASNAQMHDATQHDLSLRHMSSEYQPSTCMQERMDHLASGGTPSKLPSPPDSEGDFPKFTTLLRQGQHEPQSFSASQIDRVGNLWSYPSPEEGPSSKPVSPGKRKALQPEASTTELNGSFALDKVQQPDLSAEPKRRKVAQHEDPDILMDDSAVDAWLDDVGDEVYFNQLARISTGLMGNAQSSTSAWYKKDQNDGTCLPPKTGAGPSTSKTHVASSGANKQTAFVWPNPYYSQPRSAVRIDEVHDSSADEISPTTTSSAASARPILSQLQIQRNYQEFAQRQQKKAAERAYYTATIPGFDGVVSPTDAEAKTFESIFLDDAKDTDAGDWESATEGVSEGMSGISLGDD